MRQEDALSATRRLFYAQSFVLTAGTSRILKQLGWREALPSAGPAAYLLLVGVLAIGSVSRTIAQEQGVVMGAVTDQTGAALPGVTVELQSRGLAARTEVTDEDGAYRFDEVPPGRVVLSFRLINFAETRHELVVAPGETAEWDATLYLSLAADITVTGPRTFRNLAEFEPLPDELIGIASAASQGVVTARQIRARPVSRAGEVLETIPGMVASQHSSEGKSNQYYLRGFNLDHGTDFATTVAGVPINLPTHAHGQGYTDLNFLIPELVSGVQFRKGPYFADDGDFSAAGSSRISYVNELDAPILRFGGGEDGWARVLGAASPRVADGTLLAAVELNRNDGPWVRPDNYRRVNGVLRYTRGDVRNGFSITALGYSADWDATDQVPRRAVESGLISRFEGLDDTLGGDSFRYAVAADAQRSSGAGVTRVSGFVQRYGLNLFSNFTYLLDDPVNGDQFEQEDRRWVSGGQISHRRLATWWGKHVETAMGGQLRHDAIGAVGLFRTRDRQRLSTIRQDEVGQTSAGLFADAEIEWSSHVRTVLGLRGDGYWADVTADDPRNGGEVADGLVSPKAALVLGPWKGTEVYVNGGFGFHSNDARGATIRVDPTTGGPLDPVSPLVRARGAEVGIRTVTIPGLESTVTVWTLGLDSELVFAGDAGTTEASRASRRIGVEWTNYWQVQPWAYVDADLAFTRARFAGDDPTGDRIPGAPEVVVALGLTVEDLKGGFGSVRLRHFGPRPLVEDNRVRSEATTLVNGQLGYALTDQFHLVLDVFNLFDVAHSDVDYFYTSRLPGEPALGIEDGHFHPTIPRTVRLGARIGF